MKQKEKFYKKLFSSPLFDGFVGLFFPRGCHSCGRPLRENETIICLVCADELPFTEFEKTVENPVFQNLAGFTMLHAATALLSYERGSGVQTLIHRLKYENHPEIGRWAGALFAEKWLAGGVNPVPQVLIPIPMHPKKQQKRGYNQAEEIAKGMADVFGCGIVPALQKTKNTASQTKLSREQRAGNTQGLFQLKAELAPDLYNKQVMVVDDVFTTGATLKAALAEVQKTSPAILMAGTLAYAP